MKQMMLIGTLAVALPFLLLGCNRNDQGTPKEAVEAANASAGSADAKAPYYHGLIKEYESLLAQDPKNLAAVIALGNAYFESGQWKQAIAVYEKAVVLDPRNADLFADMGTSFRNMGMPEKAIAKYHAALKYDPGHQNARYNLGVVYAYDKRNYAEAIRVWEDLLRIAPNHPQSENMRSCIVTFKKVAKKENEK